MNSLNSKKIAYLALFTAVAMIFSYVESLIPLNIGIPGVKPGIANIVSVIVLYLFGFYEALIVVALRVILTGFLFGNAYSIIYSLAGGIISLSVMAILKKTKAFSVIGISMAGGVFHNMGQLLVAAVTVSNIRISFYGPILIIAGLIMGLIIGYISRAVHKRVETYVRL